MPSTDSSAVRVRFAPSPTGMLHIGGLRTALYNYLLARRHGGQFILRIEDTDRERYVDGAEDDILEALAWAQLPFDEGPTVDGPAGPYRQSERSDRYRQHVERLVEEGAAYYAFDTKAELEAMRTEQATDANPSPTYDASTRMQMRNSLTLPADEVQRLLDDGAEYVVRLKVPEGRSVHFEDVVRGAVSFDTDKVDDQVLLKSDGLPTYHLANVVDDRAMEITHVIRGEEWLPSTPKHVLLYEAFGWTPPRFAHLPLILSPEGGKLSKRDADQLGIPVFVRDYRAAGYEPEALVNFLAFLGWNPGDEQEVFTLGELAEAFALERVGSSGVQFDRDKLQWFNQQHLRRLDPADLAARVRPVLQEAGYAADDDYLRTVLALMQDRLTFADDLAREHAYFFEAPETYEEKGVKKRWKDDAAELMRLYADRLESAEPFDAETTEAVLRDLADARDHGAGRIIHPTRLAISGRSFGPSLFDLMAVLGRDRCTQRMRRAADVLG